MSVLSPHTSVTKMCNSYSTEILHVLSISHPQTHLHRSSFFSLYTLLEIVYLSLSILSHFLNLVWSILLTHLTLLPSRFPYDEPFGYKFPFNLFDSHSSLFFLFPFPPSCLYTFLTVIPSILTFF